jgi:uncharacterized membrane protein YdfJ with MMPL/SSD domain
MPLFLFSVLVWLSMDHQVFLLSRIHERYAQAGDPVVVAVGGSPAAAGSPWSRRSVAG